MFRHDYKKYPELTNKQLQTIGLSSPHKQITEDFDATVVKVHDGDTVTLRMTERDFDFPLRLADINAPEMSEGGEKSKKWLENLLIGMKVRVLVDPYNRVGKYGRLLGKIMFGGLDVGLQMVYLGFAKPFGQRNEGEIPDHNQLFDMRQWF